MTQNQQLVDTLGQIQFSYCPKVRDVNYLDYDLRSALDKPRSNWYKKIAFNQFQFISFTSPELIVGMAIVDLKIASNAFVYLYQPGTQDFEEFSFIQPFAKNTFIGQHPDTDTAYFKQGKNRLSFSAGKGKRKIDIDLPGKLQIQAKIDEYNQDYPLRLCSRAGYQGWVFTQKAQALKVQGTVNWRNKPLDLNRLKALASVDWSAGYMRRETFWNWASLACYLPDGRRLGFNFAAGVNETGLSENILWLDGKAYKIDMLLFQFERYDKSSHWQLNSNDGMIKLRFKPVGKRQDKQNKIIIVSNFTQFFGTFSGEIVLPNEAIRLHEAWGLTEDHYAKW